MVEHAEDKDNPMKFDMMIAEGNSAGKQLITSSIKSLVIQTRYIEKVARFLQLGKLNPENIDHAIKKHKN